MSRENDKVGQIHAGLPLLHEEKYTYIYIYIKCMIGSVQTKGGGEGSNVRRAEREMRIQ